MSKRLSVSSIKPVASRKLTPSKLTPIKQEDSHVSTHKTAQEKKNQELIRRKNEIMAHRRREEEWFKIQFQLMTNAWDNLEAEGEVALLDQKAEEEEEDAPKEDQEMREVQAEITCYRTISDERRVYLCGGLRQDGEECFSVTSWNGGTMISKGKGKNAGQPIIQQTRRETDIHNAANIARRRSSCACAVTKNFLFITGGYTTRFGTLRSTLRLDRGVTGRWRPEEGLLERREGHACIGSDVDEGILYVIGGSNGSVGPLSSTERARLYFDGQGEVRLKRWEVGPRMLARRGNLAAARIADEAGGRDEIYATGGFSETQTVLSTVEVCDLGANVWAPFRGLSCPRACHAAATLGPRIFIVGGTDGSAALATAETLDPREGRWRPAPSMGRPRCGLSLAALGPGGAGGAGGELSAIGGRQYMDSILEAEMRATERAVSRAQGNSRSTLSREFCDVIEVYDERRATWTDYGARPYSAETAVDRAFAGCAVL